MYKPNNVLIAQAAQTVLFKFKMTIPATNALAIANQVLKRIA